MNSANEVDLFPWQWQIPAGGAGESLCFQAPSAPELTELLLLLEQGGWTRGSPGGVLPLSRGSFSGITQRGGTAWGTAASPGVPLILEVTLGLFLWQRLVFGQFWVDICCLLPLSSSNAFGLSYFVLLDTPSSIFVSPLLSLTPCSGVTFPSPLSCSQPSSGKGTLIFN